MSIKNFARNRLNDMKELWEDLDKKSKLCTFLGIVVGLLMMFFMAYDVLSGKGCAMLSPSGRVGLGIAMMFTGGVLGLLGGVMLRVIFEIPEGLRTLKDRKEQQALEDEEVRKHYLSIGRLPPQPRHYNYRKLAGYVAAFLLVVAAIVGVGYLLGYMAWLLVC
jgi:hypothetical protein